MDTRFLGSFVLAVDNGSIAEAPRRLDLAAAVVAKRIHALENARRIAPMMKPLSVFVGSDVRSFLRVCMMVLAHDTRLEPAAIVP